MIRRTAFAAAAVAAALALPASAAADPLAGVKQCKQELGWTVYALQNGEPQSPDCRL